MKGGVREGGWVDVEGGGGEQSGERKTEAGLRAENEVCKAKSGDRGLGGRVRAETKNVIR